jgi:hypothetical protein
MRFQTDVIDDKRMPVRAVVEVSPVCCEQKNTVIDTPSCWESENLQKLNDFTTSSNSFRDKGSYPLSVRRCVSSALYSFTNLSPLSRQFCVNHSLSAFSSVVLVAWAAAHVCRLKSFHRETSGVLPLALPWRLIPAGDLR